jgi:hypothetical protein
MHRARTNPFNVCRRSDVKLQRSILEQNTKSVTKFRYSLSNENLPHICPSQNVICTIVPSGIGQNVARSEDVTLVYKLYFESIKEKIYFLNLSVVGGLVGGGFSI